MNPQFCLFLKLQGGAPPVTSWSRNHSNYRYIFHKPNRYLSSLTWLYRLALKIPFNQHFSWLSKHFPLVFWWVPMVFYGIPMVSAGSPMVRSVSLSRHPPHLDGETPEECSGQRHELPSLLRNCHADSNGWRCTGEAPSPVEQCSKPLLVVDYRGLYYPIYWGLR